MNRIQQPEEQKPLTAQAVEARYNAENLPREYVGNPLTEALPGIICYSADYLPRKQTKIVKLFYAVPPDNLTEKVSDYLMGWF